MKPTKRITGLLLATATLFSLAACGENTGIAPEGAEPAPALSSQDAASAPAVLEFDATLASARVVVDGIVNICDIGIKDGSWYLSAEDARAVFGAAPEESYVALDSYAQAADIRYEQDAVLNAAYFSTWESYDNTGEASLDFERAFQLELVSEDWRSRAGEQIASAEFRAMLAALIEQVAPEQMAFFDENVTDYDTPMTRGMGFIMAYYAAVCLGADNFNNDFDNTRVDTDDLWDAWPELFEDLFPHCGEGPAYCGREGQDQDEWTDWGDALTAAYLWSFWHSSPASGNLIFTFDEEAGSMHQKEPLTVQEAVAVVARLHDFDLYVPITDPAVTVPNGAILTAEHMAKASESPAVTAEDHPVWTGFIFGSEYSGLFAVEAEQLRQSANFGFNSARIKLDYETLFSPDATEANLTRLQALDKLVKTAIENNLHLNLCLTTLPGRAVTLHSDYTSEGDFDLFINPKKQEKANAVWAALAARYQDVPSANLSFTPFWEALNWNLSTGLPYPEYTPEDVGAYLADVIDMIRAQDEDRLIIYEPTSNNISDSLTKEASAVKARIADRQNVMISYNFCEIPYVYASMTATEGAHIDTNNHSLNIPSYPNYIYSVAANIWDDAPVTFDGLLPEGTVLDLYLRQSWGGNSTLTITADGKELYRERLGDRTYETGELVSGLYPYAISEKKISVTLPADTEELVVACTQGSFAPSGIDLYLPEEYAVDRWYYASAYDVYMGYEEAEGVVKKSTPRVMICPNGSGTHITIHEDLSYTSEELWAEASSDTVSAWGNAIADFDGNCMVRFECATFSSTTWASMAAYYEDILSMCAEHGYSWWSNDWWPMTSEYAQTLVIAECPSAQYGGYSHFNLELLQLLQKYQCSERP